MARGRMRVKNALRRYWLPFFIGWIASEEVKANELLLANTMHIPMLEHGNAASRAVLMLKNLKQVQMPGAKEDALSISRL